MDCINLVDRRCFTLVKLNYASSRKIASFVNFKIKQQWLLFEMFVCMALKNVKMGGGFKR